MEDRSCNIVVQKENIKEGTPPLHFFYRTASSNRGKLYEARLYKDLSSYTIYYGLISIDYSVGEGVRCLLEEYPTKTAFIKRLPPSILKSVLRYVETVKEYLV